MANCEKRFCGNTGGDIRIPKVSSTTSIATQTGGESNLGSVDVGSLVNNLSTVCTCLTCKKFDRDSPKENWDTLRLNLMHIYRDAGLVLSQNFIRHNQLEECFQSKFSLLNTERLKELVHRLCVFDRYKLYQCLECQVRLFVLEIRLNLLKHLDHGSQTLFEAMIDQYGKLCKASKKSAQFLLELETKHLRKFNLTWEFINRRLFHSTIYCDPHIKHGLPKLTALTKDPSLIDMYARFLKFEDEMTVISVVWREAQQCIDKCDKYAILNKRKAILKECEQLSVELVLSGENNHPPVNENNEVKHSIEATVSANGLSFTCSRKSSLDCLNQRFLEEQKLLKPNKNMQSINMATEADATLQEQVSLSHYGEWDCPESMTTSYPKLRSPMSTQVDVLCSAVRNKHHEHGDCLHEPLDDEDDYTDEEDDDEDIDDEEDEDSCSDHSSTTSTSTTNNQRDGGRVCDCCYCEVFGHGMPAVAPTSRNYNEMRERLRMRLSKRKAEKNGCENHHGPQQQVHSPTTTMLKKRTENSEVGDNRDLEELLSFINGGASLPENEIKKREKQKKKKERQKEKKVVIPKESPERKSRTKKENVPCISQQSDVLHVPNGHVVDTGHKTKSITEKKIATVLKESESISKLKTENLPVNGNAVSENCRALNGEHGNHSNEIAQDVNAVCKNTNCKQLKCKESRRNKVNMKKKDELSPDEVFMPKDVDLENGEMDEFEKELEAFKRFCADSKPLARKEKINVNLKEIFVKKRSPIKLASSSVET
ncbi:Uncharacterized protein HDE_02338 [Halotydeus destructor]|nr:Uncharacterized protein HDE_02338 [Halotydeus destructor]